MGLVGSVGFVLKCFDVLAWPLLAVGYPLYASIVAIETNSGADAQKLVTFWVLFSLISLIEHALGTLLLWLPIWPYIKLAFITWLMIPHFDGAFYVYEHLVRPCLCVSSRAIIDGLNKGKELSLKGEDFLVEAEKCLNENGPQALENLLSSQSMCKKPMLAPKSIVEAEGKERSKLIAVVESSYNENTVGQKDNKVAELKDCNEVITAEATGDRAGPNLTETRFTLPTPPSVQAPGQDPLHEGQKEWTCALCQVTTTGESVLKSHLQGKKHKAALAALKPKKQARKVKKSDQSKQDTDKCGTGNRNKLKIPKKQGKVKKEGSGVGQPAAAWCSICDVTCTGIGNFVEHCNGKNHMARIQELTSSNNGC